MTHFDLHKQFIEGIERERVRLGYTQQQFADKLEMSLSAYKRMINNTTEKIDLYVAYRLYCLTGKMAYEFTKLTSDRLELSKKLKDLSPMQISYIDGLVDFERSFLQEFSRQKDLSREKDAGDFGKSRNGKVGNTTYNSSSQKENPEDYITVLVPTGNMEDGMICDSAHVIKVKMEHYRKRYGNQISCGIMITGNHLHPTYVKGDILLISRKTIRDGDTGIFINRDTGHTYIRKFRQTSPCQLLPVNGMGEAILVDDTDPDDMERWIKFGQVITKVREEL